MSPVRTPVPRAGAPSIQCSTTSPVGTTSFVTRQLSPVATRSASPFGPSPPTTAWPPAEVVAGHPRRELGPPRPPSGSADTDDGFGELGRPGRAEVSGVAVVEDPAVGTDQPVAPAVRGGSDADDGLGQIEGGRRAEEAGVAVVENAPVGPDQPVALAVRGGGDAHDGLGQIEGGR